jgi:hypothetical protein
MFADLVSAIAQAEDCSKALVMDTVDRYTLNLENLAIASRLSRDSYQEAKSRAGLSAVIYGIPIGASFEDYQKKRSDHNKSAKGRSL